MVQAFPEKSGIKKPEKMIKYVRNAAVLFQNNLKGVLRGFRSKMGKCKGKGLKFKFGVSNKATEGDKGYEKLKSKYGLMKLR